MKVFLSWSTDRSKETAKVLSAWIRQLIQSADTWISSDIEKGTRWNEKLSDELEQTKVGIICLNKDNLSSEWILFEAGALSKTKDAHVCTFLLDISPTDIKPPLSQFQHTLFEKDDIKRLVITINDKIASSNEKSLLERDLDELFEALYPKLESQLREIRNNTSTKTTTHRSDREILEEILQIARSNSQISNAFLQEMDFSLTDDFKTDRGINYLKKFHYITPHISLKQNRYFQNELLTSLALVIIPELEKKMRMMNEEKELDLFEEKKVKD